MTRLPTPGQDSGNWGLILNDYLSQSHQTDGSLKPIPSTKITGLGTAAAANTSDFDAAGAAAAAQAASIPNSTLTTDGDLLTRTGGVAARTTRAALADDAAFTGKYAPVFNVTKATFAGGADVTGGADSTAAIQAAVDACWQAGGGTVFLPSGRFRITAPIVIGRTANYVTLEGAGIGARASKTVHRTPLPRLRSVT